MSVTSKTRFLAHKVDIRPQLLRAISGLQCGFAKNGTDCRNLLQDSAENDEIKPKKYALSNVFARL